MNLKVLHNVSLVESDSAENVVVNGATMENGMLYIELERIVPRRNETKTITID